MQMQRRVTAVLGPTNTGKTHYAIERMLAHRSGMIGLPLRLLAREVYDKIVALRGPSVVALVTGEERIVPERAAYWVCTVEAMPEGIGAEFVAIDEIQLCADPERGHVFTDRLLRMRGLLETMFLGAHTMRGAIAALVPEARFERRERFSELTYTGGRKLSRMPARSAIVAFSADSVYAIAELLRRQKGGAAVVMGALSPRTRNAQVEMYQSGEVNHLVATDAIGMGLNLDIHHVAFAGLDKFDGRRMRPLFPHELGQIAGRAGRHTMPGTFGVTGEAGRLDEGIAEAIVAHRFAPVRRLQWRNAALDFGSPERLVESLEARPEGENSPESWLARGREADDLAALRRLLGLQDIRARLATPADTRLLWDVCRIPDFRGISPNEHAGLLGRLFGFLHAGGRVPDEWLARQVARIDRTDGDIDALSRRLAFIRTWTYVAQRRGWVGDESHWRGETRAVEDRLSDALHGALTKQFVDRRTSVLLRGLKQREGLVAEVNDKGEVTVEGQYVGRLEGFRFRQDESTGPDAARTLRQASMAALAPEFHLRADRFYNAPDTEIDFTEQGGLMWGSQAVGKLVAGPDALRPQVVAFVDEEAGAAVAEKVTRRLQHFIDRKVAALFEPLMALSRDETLTGLARGFAFRLVEGLGIVPREEVAADVKALDQEARGALRRHGVRFGQFTVFLPLLLKPAPTRLRLVLWGLAEGLAEFPESPPPGLVTVPVGEGLPAGYFPRAGYRAAGARAIRIDMLERLADMLRARDSRAGFEATPDMLSITGMTLEQFADLMGGLGYRAERGERAKARAVATAEGAVGEAGAAEPVAPQEAAPEPQAPEPQAPEALAPEALEPEALEPEAPEPEAADAPAPAEAAAPEPVTAEPAEADLAEAAPAVAEEASAEPADAPAAESPTGAPEAEATTAEAAAPEELEVFYTFTWAPRRQGGGRPARGPGKGRRGPAGAAPAGDGAPSEAPLGAGPRGARGPGHGGKAGKGMGGKGKRGKDGRKEGGKPGTEPRQHEPRQPEPRAPRKDKPIDPDNPFAAALMGLRDKL